MVDDRVLKFHIQILHEKNSWPVVFSCTCNAPCWNNVPLKTNFENLVCKISQNVFELEPSYLVCWLGLRRRSPD